MSQPVIHLFFQDLRLGDNIALRHACDTGHPVIPLYILDPDFAEINPAYKPGTASLWWLHHSLEKLQQSLKEIGSDLVLRRGPTQEILLDLVRETGASLVTVTRRYEPAIAALDETLATAFSDAGADYKRFRGNLLFEPEAIKTKSNTPYKVFTPFYKACLEQMSHTSPADTPEEFVAPEFWPDSDDLSDWGLLPTQPDWAGGLRESWVPGETGAREALENFLDGPVTDYSDDRDRPDRVGTSRLSPHLHFGEISPRQCWHSTQLAADMAGEGDKGHGSFLREVIWREFSYYLLHHWPELPHTSFHPKFDAFPWRDDPAALVAWQKGQTGYPIVDAGMRQLWQTGWMHNRVRMVAASFLVKHLLIDWRHGADWFLDTLVDADLANNSAGWQWVAGSGADASPYFRIFNPMTQGEKFDPKGLYIREWVPEIADLPDKYLNQPWDAPDDILAEAGVTLGETYPEPIVSHKTARQRALDAYGTL